MNVRDEVLANVSTGTPPEKHRRVRDENGKSLTPSELSALERMSLSLEGIVKACKRWGADPHEVIARALSAEAEADAERTGMTLREQARLAWNIVDKAEPSRKAYDIDAQVKGTLSIGIVRFSDTAPVAAEAVPTPDVDGA